MENGWIHLRTVGGPRRVASKLCAARGIWRHGHRGHSFLRGVEACKSGSSQFLRAVATAWDYRPGDCREPGNNRWVDQPARPVDGPDDDAAIVPNSHIPCAAICDFSRYLHWPGKVLESRFGERSSNDEAGAASGGLRSSSTSRTTCNPQSIFPVDIPQEFGHTSVGTPQEAACSVTSQKFSRALSI